MRESTKQAIAFLGLGAAALLGFIIWAQRETGPIADMAARKAHIQARQTVIPKGMVQVLAGPTLRGEDAQQLEEKQAKTDFAFGPIAPDAAPVRMIFLDTFFLDVTEVTNKEYRRAVEAKQVTPPAATASTTHEDYFTNPQYDDHPVVNVTWLQARAYCESQGKRLPTEAEWEKAARGRDTRLWTWGDDWHPEYTNTADAGRGDTVAVRSIARDRSPYGVADLVGNVQEWVADWYGPAAYASSEDRNPSGPTAGSERVVRGGGFKSNAWESRTTARGRLAPDAANAWTGFRCAQDAVYRWQTERANTTGSRPKPENAEAKKRPRLRIDERAHRFGRIWQGDPVEHTFQIKNVGDEPLRILDTQAKCGCTTLGEIAGVVEPGQAWPLPVQVNTDSAHGLANRIVYLATDDPDRPYTRLYLYGEIRRKLEAEPTHYADLQQLKRDEVREKIIRLTNNTDEPVQFDTPTPSDEWFEAKLVERQAGRRWDLVIRTVPPLPYGSLIGKVTIGTSLDRPNPFEIRVSGRVPARVVVRPTTLIVPSPAKTDLVRRVQVLQTEGGQVKLTSARVDHEDLEVEIEKREGDSPVVALTVPAGTTLPEDGTDLWIETNDPEFPELKVRVLNKPARSPLPSARKPASPPGADDE